MTTTPMSLSDQLRALAKLHSLPRDYRRQSMFPFNPAAAGGGIGELVPMLRAVGIEPTDAAKFDELTAITFTEPAEPAGRRLDLDPDTFRQRIVDVAVYRSVHQVAARQAGWERELLTRELLLSMRDEADSYITLLRPAFEAAIADFRTAVDLGITVTTTAEDAMKLGPKAVEAWMRMTNRDGAARVLDGIAGLRIRLSTALGIEPVNRHGYTDAIAYGVCFGAGATFDDHDGWRRWLPIAETGTARLLPVAEVPRTFLTSWPVTADVG